MKKTIYDHIFKERVVLASYKVHNIAKLEEELGLYHRAIARWREAYHKSGIEGFKKKKSVTGQGKYEILELENEISKVDLKYEILRNAFPYLGMGQPIIFKFIAQNEKKYPTLLMCKTLGVPTSAYKRWRNQDFTQTEQKKKEMQQLIASIFNTSKQLYGRDRIRASLYNSGHQISASTVGKYMKELGLSSQLKKRKKRKDKSFKTV